MGPIDMEKQMRSARWFSLVLLSGCLGEPEPVSPLQAVPPVSVIRAGGLAIAGEPLEVLVELPVARDDLSVNLVVGDGGLGDGTCPRRLRGACVGVVGEIDLYRDLEVVQGISRLDLEIEQGTDILGLQVVVLSGSDVFLSAPVEVAVDQPVYLDRQTPIDGGVTVTIDDGPNGLGVVEALGEELLGDLSAFLPPNPFYEDRVETCLFFCFPWYALELDIEDFRVADTHLTIDPDPGVLSSNFVAQDAVIDWSARLVIAGIPSTVRGQIFASSIDVDLGLVPVVVDGVVRSDLRDVRVELNDFDFDLSGLLSVLRFLGVEWLIGPLVEDLMIDTLQNAVIPEVVPAIDELFDGFGVDDVVRILDFDVGVIATPSSLSIDDEGMVVDLVSNALTTSWTRPELPGGSYFLDIEPPVLAADEGLAAVFSVDLLNRALYEAWGNGAVDRQVALSDLPPDPALNSVLPAALDLTLSLDPRRAPELRVVDGALGLSVRDLVVDVEVTGTDQVFLQVGVDVSADVAVAQRGMDVEFTLGEFELDTTILGPNDLAVGPDTLAIEATFDTALRVVVTELFGELARFTIPDVGQYGVRAPSTQFNPGGFIQIDGEVVRVP